MKTSLLAMVAALASASLLLASQACSDPAPQPTARACDDSRDCPGGQLCSCEGVCYTPAPCAADVDCCANEVCDDGRCAERNECRVDADCGGGLSCAGCACTPPACAVASDCADGRTCEGGVCVPLAEPPCGGCATGEACDPVAGACVPRPEACAAQACGPGETLLVEGLAERLGPVCAEPLRCSCAAARPAAGFRLGAVFSAVLVDGDTVGVLAHEHRYDDLVYVELDRGGVERARVWVDGVPTGPVVAAPDGPRGGIIDPGFAMGRSPDAALQGGTIGVSYRDDSNETLRFALSTDRRSWTAGLVDGEGDVGEHSALVPLGGQDWGVAYSALSDAGAELRWATTSLAEVGPAVAPTWATQTIASGPTPDPRAATVRAFGRYPSARLLEGIVYIAWYDGAEGNLMLSWGMPSGPFTTAVLDEGATRSEIPGAGDVGRHAALLTTAAGGLAVAYVDHIAGTVLFAPLVRDDVGSWALDGVPEVAALGRQDLPPRLVGADLFATRSAVTGEPILAFQDSTEGDLVLALRSGGAWERVTVARTGAAGFSPHVFPSAQGTLAVDGLVEEGPAGLSERLTLRVLPY